MGRKLVAYFSASGTTKKTAETVAQAGKFDLYEITPKEAYTKADLKRKEKKSRSSVEMNDKKFRPEIVKKPINTADYDEIILGFPIWWYVARQSSTHSLNHMISRARKLFFLPHRAEADSAIQSVNLRHLHRVRKSLRARF